MKPTFGEPFKNQEYQIRKGAYAIIFNPTKDKVLTVHNKGYHFLPGGGIEVNESDADCIEREMHEETGYAVWLGSFIGTAKCYFISSKNEFILNDGYFYLARLGEKVQNPSEVDHFMEWVHIDDIDKLFFYKHQTWAVKKAVGQ